MRRKWRPTHKQDIQNQEQERSLQRGNGAIDKRRGCTALAREWKRPVAHPSACRDRIAKRILEDGDIDDSVKHAIEKSLGEGGFESELAQFIEQSDKMSKMSMKQRFDINRARRVQALMDQKVDRELDKVTQEQNRKQIREQDILSNSLERSFIDRRQSETLLPDELNKGMTDELKICDVAEIYSPPRVTRFAKEFGFIEEWGLDLTTCDDAGQTWDFNRPEMRRKARELVEADRPTLAIGSFVPAL